jgi:hypothetical protein
MQRAQLERLLLEANDYNYRHWSVEDLQLLERFADKFETELELSIKHQVIDLLQEIIEEEITYSDDIEDISIHSIVNELKKGMEW